MTSFHWQLVSGGLLVACLASFGWGMRKFFSRPAGDTPGMRVIQICGALFALLHLAAIALTPRSTAALRFTIEPEPAPPRVTMFDAFDGDERDVAPASGGIPIELGDRPLLLRWHH